MSKNTNLMWFALFTLVFLVMYQQSKSIEGYSNTRIYTSKSAIDTFFESTAYKSVSDVFTGVKKNTITMDLSEVMSPLSEDLEVGKTGNLTDPARATQKVYVEARYNQLKEVQANMANFNRALADALTKSQVAVTKNTKVVNLSLPEALESITNSLNAIKNDLGQVPD